MSLHVQGVGFAYQRARRVFEGLTVRFEEGRTVLLGPNGAGKSTLLSLAADALRPQAGEIAVDGVGSASGRGNRSRYRQAVGWLPQHAAAFPGLNAREHVAYAGWLKGLNRTEAWDRALSALVSVDLDARAEVRASTLSGGQLRRLGVASALVAGATWILLDEPTAGLDPAQRARFSQVMQNLPADVSIIVSTHQTEDVYDTYGQVVLLVDGKVPFHGTVADFTAADPEIDPRDAVARAYSRYVGAED